MTRGRVLFGGLIDSGGPPPHRTSAEERVLVDALRRRDEDAFVALVERFHGSLLRTAFAYCPNPAVAEDVVQETCSEC